MTRRQHLARVHTKDFPFSGEYSARFELPQRVSQRRLVSADAWDEHPIQYHRHLDVATTEAGSVLEVTFEPPKDAITRAEKALGRNDLTDYLGYVRYVWAPYDLVHFASALYPGEPRYTNAFAPGGPFEFVPPEHGYDYRTRARLQLPTAVDTVHDAAHLLLDLLTQSRARRTEPLMLRFIYETRHKRVERLTE